MPPHELPPELDRWPSDPHALLGVSADVDPRDLKRAYTHLIRAYKPEQFPDHFRRLREAYETVLRQVQFRAMFQSNTVETQPDDGEPAVSQPGDDATTVTRSTVPNWYQQLDEIWETACSGLEQPAYRRFVELEQLHLGHPDLCVRLYWLLALSPELDWGHDAADWLAKGLTAGGLQGPLYELYRRQLESQPQEALSARCDRLLAAPANPGTLVNFLELRWRAATAAGDAGPLVAQDLERLQARIAGEDEEVWGRLLIAAIEYLAWSGNSETRGLASRYRQEIEAAEHLHRRLEDLIDRADMALEIAAVWRKQHIDLNVGDELIALVRQSRLMEFSQVRPRLEAYMAWALDTPGAMLQMLTSVARQSSVAAAAFGELLEHWGEVSQLTWYDRSEEPMPTLVRDFVRRSNFHDYDAWRPLVLDFCLDESLLAWQMAQLLEGVEIDGIKQAAERLRGDQALKFVALAAQLFWA